MTTKSNCCSAPLITETDICSSCKEHCLIETTLPRLYKTTKTGALQICDISYEGPIFTVLWGQLEGKTQTKNTTCTGKNQGRSNETTPSQQAEKEALAKFKKKVDSGYSESIETPSEVLLPQKVKTYQDQKKNIKYPCIVQLKLNGINGEYRIIDGVLRLLSRGGLDYDIIPRHVESVLAIMKKLDTTSLNGEIYIHGLHLQDITAAVKKHNDRTSDLEFYIFDFPEIDSTYEEDLALHDYIRDKAPKKCPVNSLTHQIVECEAELDDLQAMAVRKGYEGLIIRNMDGKYKYNQRSSDVFKYKVAQDAEFKILDSAIDKNGHPVFIMDNPNGTDDKSRTFKVKPKGTSEERLQIVQDFEEKYKDKFYKVEFETLSKSNVPLKPIGLGLRLCNNEGEPIE